MVQVFATFHKIYPAGHGIPGGLLGREFFSVNEEMTPKRGNDSKTGE